MCISFFGFNVFKEIPFFLCFNRDEEFSRETGQFGPSEEFPDLIYSLDLITGGTFLCLNSKNGNFCCLLNNSEKYNEGAILKRGLIPIEFCLKNDENSDFFEFFENLKQNSQKYNGFNIICGNILKKIFFYYTNNDPESPIKLESGQLYGISNHHIFDPFQKVKHGLELFNKIDTEITFKDFKEEALKIMKNREKFEKIDIVEDFDQHSLLKNVLLKKYMRSSIFMESNLKIEEDRVVLTEHGTRQTIIIMMDLGSVIRASSIEYKVKKDDNLGKLVLTENEEETEYDITIE